MMGWRKPVLLPIGYRVGYLELMSLVNIIKVTSEHSKHVLVIRNYNYFAQIRFKSTHLILAKIVIILHVDFMSFVEKKSI